MLPELANRGIHREAFLVGGQRKCGTHSPARPHVRGKTDQRHEALDNLGTSDAEPVLERT